MKLGAQQPKGVDLRQATAVVLVIAAIAAGSASSASQRPAAFSTVTCRGAISWQNARSAIGRVATIRGRVAGTRFASTSSGSPTFLNVGANYPNPRRFTVVIWIENRGAFGRPEMRYRRKNICVRGRVTSYEGVPEIEARSPSQIRVVR
jgi:hypothetical protein